MKARKPLGLWLGLVVAVLATLYSFGGIAMTSWLTAVPGIPPARIRNDFVLWVPTTFVSLGTLLVFLFRLVKHYKQSARLGAPNDV